jgi:hypothetical protein
MMHYILIIQFKEPRSRGTQTKLWLAAAIEASMFISSIVQERD